MSAIDEGRYALRKPGDEVKQKAQSGRGWYAVLARVGLVAKGVSFGLVGVLAVKLALGSGGKATSREGALAQLAHHTFGKVALVALAFGFAAYAIWRFVQAFAEEPDADDGAAKVWGKRAGYVGRGLIYAALTISTVKILAGSGSGGSQTQRAHKSTAMVLGWPGGRELVAAAGIVIVAVGLWNLYRGLSRKFEDKWRVGEPLAALAPVGRPCRRRGPRRTLRRVRADRHLPREGGMGLQPEGRDRDRRCAPEARARVVRAVPARRDGRRADRLRRVLPRRRAAAGRLRRARRRWTTGSSSGCRRTASAS